MSTTVSSAETARPTRPRGLLTVLSGNMLLDAVEVSAIVVALPAVTAHFALSFASAQWMLTAFAIGFGAGLIVSPRLTVRWGRRRCYLAALSVFAMMSLVGALAPDLPVLLMTRVVKGACAALTAPTGLTILSATYGEGPARNRALRTYALFGAAGLLVGLLLAGVLATASWRWILAFPAPVAILLGALGSRVVPVDTGSRNGALWRPVATALSAAAAAAGAVYALVYGPSSGVRFGTGLAVVASALAVLAAASARRGRADGVRASVHRRALSRPAVVAALLNGALWSLLLVVTRWLRDHGWTAPAAASAFAPTGVMVLAVTWCSARLLARSTPDVLVRIGTTVLAVGYVAVAVVALRPVATPNGALAITALLLALSVVGVGFGASFAALHVQAMRGVAERDRGAAGTRYQVAVQLGGAALVALCIGVSYSVTDAAVRIASGQTSELRVALLVVAGYGCTAALVAGLRSPLRKGPA